MNQPTAPPAPPKRYPMDQFKKAWLAARGLLEHPDIVDCDPDTGLVEFADGTQRQACEVYSRVMGYHRPTFAMNPGKQSEHAERKLFTEGAIAAREAEER